MSGPPALGRPRRKVFGNRSASERANGAEKAATHVAFKPEDYEIRRTIHEHAMIAWPGNNGTEVMCIDPRIVLDPLGLCDAILPALGTVCLQSRLWHVFDLTNRTVRYIIDCMARHHEPHFPEKILRDVIMTVCVKN